MSIITRRRFLKTATGLYIPTLFGLSLPGLAQMQNAGAFFAANDIAGGGGACNTLKEDIPGSTNNADTIIVRYTASQFTPGSSYTCCRVDLRMNVGSETAGVWTGHLWSDNAGNPGTLLSSSTNSYTAAQIGAADKWVEFDFSGQALTSGTPYWAGCDDSQAPAISGYGIRDSNAGGNLLIRKSTDGTTWVAAFSLTWWIRTYVS